MSRHDNSGRQFFDVDDRPQGVPIEVLLDSPPKPVRKRSPLRGVVGVLLLGGLLGVSAYFLFERPEENAVPGPPDTGVTGLMPGGEQPDTAPVALPRPTPAQEPSGAARQTTVTTPTPSPKPAASEESPVTITSPSVLEDGKVARATLAVLVGQLTLSIPLPADSGPARPLHAALRQDASPRITLLQPGSDPMRLGNARVRSNASPPSLELALGTPDSRAAQQFVAALLNARLQDGASLLLEAGASGFSLPFSVGLSGTR